MVTTDFVNTVKKFEGFSPLPYRDVGGTLTIGYGRTENVHKNELTTTERESEWLVSKLNSIYMRVSIYCECYDLSDNQLLALTDFTFNLGFGNLRNLTARNMRNIDEIAEHIRLYNKCSGIVLPGLTVRRNWEYSLFTSNKKEKSDEQKIQECINIFLEKHGSKTRIKEDGIIGKKTISALHEVFSLL